MLTDDIICTLMGPIPTLFTGDPAQAQRFIDKFGQLKKANRRHPFLTRPDLRVELALAFISEDPMTTGWKRTIRRRNDNGWIDESIWDEFFDSFCTAWIDEIQLPVTLSIPADEPLASISTIADSSLPVPVGTLDPTLTRSTPISDSPPPRPPRSSHRLMSPKVTQSPTSAVGVDSMQTTRFASSLPPVATTKKEEALLTPTPAPSTVPSPLTPTIAPPLTPGDETLASRIETAPIPLNILAMPRIGKRKRCVALDSGETRPCKRVIVPQRTPVTPLTDAPSPSFPYAPPPRRPCPAPGDPTRTLLISVNDNTVVEDDNMPRRGVKTLDNSVFARVLTQQTVNSPPQTLPRAHPVPHHACEKSRNPNAQANHPISRHERARSCKKPRDTSRNNLGQKHHDPDTIRKARIQHALTREERRRCHTEGRESAQRLTTEPPPSLTATCSCDSYTLNSRRYSRIFPHHAETTEAEPKIIKDRDHANAVVEKSREQQNKTRTTSRPTPASTSPVYDAVAEHLAFCLTRKPDILHITQPFPLNLEPSAILRRWKVK
ncbi:hypothetical protein EDB86DRAFT_3219379 [Lactarius hatsudake]|nr:hypothetical protein EDB86DRAFT_3219379 [Lactarius hatsudake]